MSRIAAERTIIGEAFRHEINAESFAVASRHERRESRIGRGKAL